MNQGVFPMLRQVVLAATVALMSACAMTPMKAQQRMEARFLGMHIDDAVAALGKPSDKYPLGEVWVKSGDEQKCVSDVFGTPMKNPVCVDAERRKRSLQTPATSYGYRWANKGITSYPQVATGTFSGTAGSTPIRGSYEAVTGYNSYAVSCSLHVIANATTGLITEVHLVNGSEPTLCKPFT